MVHRGGPTTDEPVTPDPERAYDPQGRKILAIDKTVKPETSTRNMVSKLKGIGVPGM